MARFRCYHTNLLGLGTLVMGATAFVGYLNPKIEPNLASRVPVIMSGGDPSRPNHAKGFVDGDPWTLGFRTENENKPWVMLDLGVAKLVSRIKIFNRLDCCLDRAFPLAIETSLDGKVFKELARINEVFHVWKPKVTPTNARYLRVRLLKTGVLHLNEIEVR